MLRYRKRDRKSRVKYSISHQFNPKPRVAIDCNEFHELPNDGIVELIVSRTLPASIQ